MSDPTPPPTGLAGASAMSLGSVGVEVEVTPQPGGDIVCAMTCNGREINVTFEDDGGIMITAESAKHHFTAKALGKT